MKNYVAHQMLVVITSLVLCIEQVTENDENPNYKERVQAIKKATQKHANNAELRRLKGGRTSQVVSRQALSDLEFQEKLRMMPLQGIVSRVCLDLDWMTGEYRSLPMELRISFLQLVNRVFKLESKGLSMDPAFIEFLKMLVISIADN